MANLFQTYLNEGGKVTGPGKPGQAETKTTFLPDLTRSERGSDSVNCHFLVYVSIGGQREWQMWNNELQPEIHAELA